MRGLKILGKRKSTTRGFRFISYAGIHHDDRNLVKEKALVVWTEQASRLQDVACIEGSGEASPRIHLGRTHTLKFSLLTTACMF